MEADAQGEAECLGVGLAGSDGDTDTDGRPNAPGRASCSTCSATARTSGSGSFWSRFTSLRKRSYGGNPAAQGQMLCSALARAGGLAECNCASTVPGSAAARQRRVRLGISAP
jgi:hypothetical protein